MKLLYVPVGGGQHRPVILLFNLAFLVWDWMCQIEWKVCRSMSDHSFLLLSLMETKKIIIEGRKKTALYQDHLKSAEVFLTLQHIWACS